MKKLSLLFIIVVVATIGCDKDESVIQTKDTKAYFEEQAKYHNLAMDHVFYSLKGDANISKLDQSSLLEKVESIYLDYIDISIDANLPKDDVISISRNEVKRLLEFRDQDFSKTDYPEYDYIIETIEYYQEYLSKAQTRILLEIDGIMNEESTVDNIVNRLNYINDVKVLELPEEERLVIYAATMTGIESVQYWYENGEAWLESLELSPDLIEMQMHKGWFDWNRCGKSDIAGAIGGGIAGAIVGAVAGGVGAIPGAATGFVSGGISASATDAVFQLIERAI